MCGSPGSCWKTAANALDEDGALLAAHDAKQLEIAECRVLGSGENGITLRQVSGRVRDCEFANIRKGAICSAKTQPVSRSRITIVHDCGDNGILVWRSDAGEDGTIVTGNRVERIEAKSDGTGQNGNGINVFRAGSVQVSGNRIADCAFTAIRANAASNCQMIGNSCARLGEVALYAEFAFEGAVIANNLVDRSGDRHLRHQLQRGRKARGGARQSHPQHLHPQGCGLARHRHRGRGRQRGERQCDRGRADLRHPYRLGSVICAT